MNERIAASKGVAGLGAGGGAAAARRCVCATTRTPQSGTAIAATSAAIRTARDGGNFIIRLRIYIYRLSWRR